MLSFIKQLFFSLLLLLAIPAFAFGSNESIESWINQNQCQKNLYLEDAKELRKNAEEQVQDLFSELNAIKNKSCIGEGLQNLKEHNDYKDKSILIFVSLSMPKESLQSLYKETETKGIPLIIRGLKNNSFKETAEVIKDLGITVQIDPNLFEEHEIKVVPTFVAINKKEPLQIKGNISLSYVRRKFEEAL